MRVLYHQSLSPFCRKVRITLAEKKLEFELRLEPVWERRAEFLALNPAGDNMAPAPTRSPAPKHLASTSTLRRRSFL